MVAPFVLVKAFTYDFAVADDHAAYVRIRTGKADAFARQSKRVLHEADVVCVHESVEERVDVGFGVEGHEVVDLFAGAHEADGQRQFA